MGNKDTKTRLYKPIKIGKFAELQKTTHKYEIRNNKRT